MIFYFSELSFFLSHAFCFLLDLKKNIFVFRFELSFLSSDVSSFLICYFYFTLFRYLSFGFLYLLQHLFLTLLIFFSFFSFSYLFLQPRSFFFFYLPFLPVGTFTLASIKMCFISLLSSLSSLILSVSSCQFYKFPSLLFSVLIRNSSFSLVISNLILIH